MHRCARHTLATQRLSVRLPPPVDVCVICHKCVHTLQCEHFFFSSAQALAVAPPPSPCSGLCSLLPRFSLRVEAVLLLVATGPADRVDQAIAQLQQADDKLQHGQAEQHAQQSHVPLHDVQRLVALRPRLGLQEIPGGRRKRYEREVTTW